MVEEICLPEEPDIYVRERKITLTPEQEKIFSESLDLLNRSGLPFMVAGAFAVHSYTGLWRNTKDMDVFIRPGDVEEILSLFARRGYDTEVRENHWLSKICIGPYFVDLIFGMGNGMVTFDQEWFHSIKEIEVGGIKAPLIQLEELITSKIYIAVRDRFDGGDIVHLIRCAQGAVDWRRIANRLGPHQELLLWHLILFDFVYPGHRDYLPQDLMGELFERVRQRWGKPSRSKICNGLLLDRYSFAVDVQDWGYKDPRDLRSFTERGGEES